MKRVLTLILIMALLPWAVAEGADLAVWANHGEDCYHYERDCGAPDFPRYALSEAAALDFDKQPCPDCVLAERIAATPAPADNAEDADITCAQRGGTWVFRFPSALLKGVRYGENPEPADGNGAALLHLYAETLEDVIDATLAIPADGAKVLCLRVIDDDAWVVIRPNKSYKAKRPLKWVAEHVAVDIFNPGKYTVTGVSEVMRYAPPKHVSSLKKQFSRDYGKLDVDVYSGQGMYIAVVHMDDALNEDSATGFMRINGADIPVSGYVEKHNEVYCFALTEAEAEALKDAAPEYYGAGAALPEASETTAAPMVTLPPDLFADQSQED